MTKNIETLPHDIYQLFETNHEFNADHVRNFGEKLAAKLASRISEERGAPTLRLSNVGTQCDRQLWYKINKPELGLKLRPETRFKFLYGDILEELVLFLAAEAGHEVVGEQDVIEVNGVVGHRDAVVDGRTVDVKSASTFSFKKFRDGKLREDDPFGYLAQIGAYSAGSKEDPLVTERDVHSFIAIDKQHGHICVDTYPIEETDYEELIESKKVMLQEVDPPPRSFESIPEGKSGNQKLGTNCSYCDFKDTCWPLLRTFLYSSGPVYLTHVEREPKVPELLSDTTDDRDS